MQQVGGESNGQGFLLVLFFFYFPIKVARENPRPPALNDNPANWLPFDGGLTVLTVQKSSHSTHWMCVNYPLKKLA